MRRIILVMFILITNRSKSKSTKIRSSLNHIEDCFYEKRIATSLDGHNQLSDLWISELDCLDRCLKSTIERCRSFEHWHFNQQGMCVRANISLTDRPSELGKNTFVNYYEIDCRKDVKAIRTESISCPGDELILFISLNGIDPNYVFLGEQNCKPTWSNESHVQFQSHVDNCSLMITDGSIVGKLRWEGVVKDTNRAKHYERFFLCPSDIFRARSGQWISTSSSTFSSMKKSTNVVLPSTVHRSSTIDRTSSTTKSTTVAFNKIFLQWTSKNRTFTCPQMCSIPMDSLVHVNFDGISLSISLSSIDFCFVKALPPYTKYFENRRLIDRSSVDPLLIDLTTTDKSDLTPLFSFYLHKIVKEPIILQIQCTISSSIGPNRNDSSTKIFFSSPMEVIRRLPSKLLETTEFAHSNSPVLMVITVHRIQCSIIFLFIQCFSLIV